MTNQEIAEKHPHLAEAKELLGYRHYELNTLPTETVQKVIALADHLATQKFHASVLLGLRDLGNDIRYSR